MLVFVIRLPSVSFDFVGYKRSVWFGKAREHALPLLSYHHDKLAARFETRGLDV